VLVTSSIRDSRYKVATRDARYSEILCKKPIRTKKDKKDRKDRKDKTDKTDKKNRSINA